MATIGWHQTIQNENRQLGSGQNDVGASTVFVYGYLIGPLAAAFSRFP
jgi:hypothetical protein